MSFSNFEDILSYKDDEYIENLSSNYNPLDNSFSLIFSKENQLKNPIEFLESQSLNNSNNKNIEGDKECSPAPAPLRSSQNINPNQSQNQNELSNSHNLECPEVVNKPLNTEDQENQTIKILKIFDYNDNNYNNDQDELVEKPFDKNRYFLENEIMAQSINNDDINNNVDLENKSAALNVIPNNENLNYLQNNVNSLISSSSASNLQELSCPNNISFSTPLGNNNKRNFNKIFFTNTKEGKKSKNKNGFIRKLKPDSLRKKIKARFHKKLRQIINLRLKECESKFLFDLFPQPFITNINIEFNRSLLNITMRELFQKIFGFKAKDREKVSYNTKVIKYLEENPHLNNDETISKFLDCTYEEIIQKYMHGKYLLEDIERLKKEGESCDYISRYTFIAIHWIDFYKNGYI